MHFIYIPLCFYFIRIGIKDNRDLLPNLHSTMLLLYPGLNPIFALNAQFTFHYASTLSLILHIRFNTVCVFTFHYASTLSESDDKTLGIQCNLHSTMLLLYLQEHEWSNTVRIIYIPLCFYFIGNSPPTLCTYLHLHSTMLLLYPEPHFATARHKKHLHSTMLLLYHRILKRRMRPFKIYIPLCFYFIVNTDSEQELRVGFTFHYASTLSWCVQFVLWSEWLFTFHYASTLSGFDSVWWDFIRRIYIPLCFYFIWHLLLSSPLRSYLHSTMLLLYRSRTVWDFIDIAYLHSTMLLLYRTNLKLSSLLVCNLHSTMLLLYHRTGALHRVCILYLHSTMLLLYRWEAVLSVPEDRIYIPLCFYFIIINLTAEEGYTIFTFHYASTLSQSGPDTIRSWMSIYIPLCFYFI